MIRKNHPTEIERRALIVADVAGHHPVRLVQQFVAPGFADEEPRNTISYQLRETDGVYFEVPFGISRSDAIRYLEGILEELKTLPWLPGEEPDDYKLPPIPEPTDEDRQTCYFTAGDVLCRAFEALEKNQKA